ncbi:GNAT family N-acetyltransferase [Paenibacillus humicola]|uniref:GNAT family N-acetyltransferase n=1 Tax=Paenibacillus humicola TaxID=3110540 RepID=UPI00237A27BE|nr:GNAT family N-acetyltransferase [Paenibacillus humicola]
MDIVILEQLDETYWPAAAQLYDEAFPKEGRKSEAIIRAMFTKGMCRLYVGLSGGETVAMAIAGETEEGRMLLIDYLAVREKRRSTGIGAEFVRRIADWARRSQRLRGILIEVECEPGETNERRIRFWQKCGFALTGYVHRYIWVPERYRAMTLSFDPGNPLPADGEELFRHIAAFHARAYRK